MKPSPPDHTFTYGGTRAQSRTLAGWLGTWIQRKSLVEKISVSFWPALSSFHGRSLISPFPVNVLAEGGGHFFPRTLEHQTFFVFLAHFLNFRRLLCREVVQRTPGFGTRSTTRIAEQKRIKTLLPQNSDLTEWHARTFWRGPLLQRLNPPCCSAEGENQQGRRRRGREGECKTCPEGSKHLDFTSSSLFLAQNKTNLHVQWT